MSLNLYKYHTNPESISGFDQATNRVPHLAWDHFRDKPKELRKREHLWAKSPMYSYLYAQEVIEEKFPQGEDAIATSAGHSYLYANDVLKGERVEKIEDAIATSAYYSYAYAIYVLKGERFEKGEDAIATDAGYSYDYAIYVLKGERFEKGEDAIRGSEYQERYEELTGVKL